MVDLVSLSPPTSPIHLGLVPNSRARAAHRRSLTLAQWWNASVESQAFARTYRRGQTLPTRMLRLVAANSVDTDMVAMQKRKEDEIQGVLESSTAKRALTLKELMGLFGEVGEDCLLYTSPSPRD